MDDLISVASLPRLGPALAPAPAPAPLPPPLLPPPPPPPPLAPPTPAPALPAQPTRAMAALALLAPRRVQAWQKYAILRIDSNRCQNRKVSNRIGSESILSEPPKPPPP